MEPRSKETDGNSRPKAGPGGNVDLYANSPMEMYYGICSFMMKNGIIGGNIYSASKEILDGLGEYMSSVGIPWGYDSDEPGPAGYRFLDGEVPERDRNKSINIILNGKKSISIRKGDTKNYDIRIHNLNAIYEDLDSTLPGKDIESPIHLKNEEIRKMFLKSFKLAEKEIDIISPWMNFAVVNEDFLRLMQGALDRKVVIKIIYGLKPSSQEFSLSRSARSDEVAEHLRNRFRKYEGQLFIKRDNIHYKLVLCDERFKLEGGYNYLSFIGDYEKTDTRREGSPYGTDIEEIRYLRKEYFSCVDQ